mgnify:CR=1 FL=1
MQKVYYCNSKLIQSKEVVYLEWVLDKKRPICPQISEQICVRIARGQFAPGEKLLSVREVAVSAGVNPNTVQHSFELLEQQGILYSVRGSGWFVGEDISFAQQTLQKMIQEKTQDYFTAMEALGMDREATINYVKEWQL